jgi:CHAT domain-containing protein
LIVGNPLFTNDPDYDMPPLPGAEQEARAVGKLFSAANVLTGDQATVQNIRLAYEKPDYLYFATHGIADPSRPIDGGFLALTNGRLTAREIQGAHLKARLAVLSACQTGLGGYSDAGTIGLARAFYLAGVDSVVMSLWDVDDEATGFLMQQFMENSIRMPPAQALRGSILRAKEKYPNEPHKWASFAYFGVVY